MKILKAEITGFGKYHEQSFAFHPQNQLLFGHNEIGKSTLYQFIAAILFGFPKKTAKKKDYTPKNGAAYGGKLWLALEPFGEVIVERYRQVDRGRAKVHVDGQTVDEQWLAQHLQPLNRALFFDVFTFQQEQLTQIDKLEENELHQALISLGISGSQKMLQQVAQYETTNQQQYKPRGQKLPLNQALKQLEKLQKTIAEKESEESRIQQQYQQIAQLQEQIQDLRHQYQALNDAYQENQQQLSHWGLYEEWQQMAPADTLADPQQVQAIKQFYQQYQQLTEEIRKKEAELDQLEQGKESDKYFFYLDHEHQIHHLLQQQVTMARLADREAAANQQEAVAITELNRLIEKRQWSRESPPLVTASIHEQTTRLLQERVQLEELEKRMMRLEEKAQPLQATAARLEQQHPQLIGRKPVSRPLWPLGIVGGLLAVIGIFLPSPWRWLALGAGIAAIIGSVLPLMKAAPNKQQGIKQEWQTILMQLDLLGEELAQLENEQQQKQQQIDRAYQALTPFFGDLPVESWQAYLLAYDEDVASYQAYSQQRKQAYQERQAVAEELAPFDEQYRPYAEWLPLQNKTVLEKAAILQKFHEEMQTIKLSRLQQPSTLLAQQLNRTRNERDQLLSQASDLLQQQGLDHPAEISLWLKQWEAAQRTQQRAEELAEMLTPIYPKPVTQAELLQQKDQIKQQQTQLQAQIQQLTEQKQRLELEAAASQKNGTLNQLYQEESELKAVIEELAVAWGSRQLAASILTDVTTELSEQQLPQLLSAASTYFEQLSNGRYQKILLENGLLVAGNASETFSIIDLSTGTKDQLIMALRFGYLALQKNHPLCPIIIDDGWLHYDSVRKERFAALLKEFGQSYQVICLSSDQEMVSYYQKYQQPIQDLSKGSERFG